MQIRFVRSGGFAGMRMTGIVDTGTLPAAEAGKVEALVAAAAFFSLPATFPAPKSGADYFTYAITVTDGSRSHAIEVSEPSAPETLRPLLRYISAGKKG